MKKNPVTNINRPAYPTMEQLKKQPGKYPIAKVAAVTALTAVMAIAATGCGEENVKSRAIGHLGLMGTPTETYQIEGEIQIDGDMPNYTDPTTTVLMGETETEATTTEDDWELSGEEAVDTDADYQTKATTENFDIQGGETVCVDVFEVEPSES